MIFLWGVLVVATIGILMARVRTVSRQMTTFLYTVIMTCAVCALVVLRAPFIDEHMLAQLRLLCAPQPNVMQVSTANTATDNAHSALVVEGLFAVTDIVDGDTIKVHAGERRETVRIIGINTPESVDPRRAVECFGAEASARAAALLSEATVILERDTTQADRDRYGRLLRHVRLADGRQFGAVMIVEGFAYEYTYNAAHAYQQAYRAAQKEARAAQRGLWAPDACVENARVEH